jgi:LysR family transcriptional regulator for metE and metH
MVLKPANVKPKKITVLPMTEACLEMVRAEMGIIVMAKWALKPYLTLYNGHLKMVKIGKNGLKRTHYIATLRNREKPDYFKHFIEFLQHEITTAWSI